MKPYLAVIFVGLVACGGSGTADDTAIDAPVAPAMLTLSGTASSIGLTGKTAEAGVLINLYKTSDDSMLGTAMSDAAGAFSITVTTTAGAAVDGYLKATKATFKDTYLYPPAPLNADFAGATVLLLTPGTWMTATSALLGETPVAGDGWIGLLVMDSLTAQTPIAGATVSSTPAGKPHYNNPNGMGLPQGQATMTAVDGIGYVVNVAAGQVSVTAAKSGSTFKAHSINARPDVITLTIVTE